MVKLNFLNRKFFLLILMLPLIAGCGTFSFTAQGKIRGDSYVVKPQDTLATIAARAEIDYKELARLNKILPPYTIQVGQKLKLKPTPQVTNLKKSDDLNKTKDKLSLAKDKANTVWNWPVRGAILSDFTSTSSSKKKGIDIGGKEGDLILAASAGTVVYSGKSLDGYGNLIIIKHSHNFLSAYAHNRENIVKEGDRVLISQRIARLGSTGTNRVKLHFEIRHHGKPVDPLQLLPK